MVSISRLRKATLSSGQHRPLRERKEDIPLLARTFIQAGNRKICKNAQGLDEEAERIFQSYDWPGNVRELQHVIEYALNILPYEQELISAAYIPEHIQNATGQRTAPPIPAQEQPQTVQQAMQQAARRCIEQALAEHDRNVSQTAGAVGLKRQNLQHYMRKLGIRKSR